jgi:arginine decarboxylase
MNHKDLYFIKRWGDGYFDINDEGHVIVKPNRQNGCGDLYKLIQTLVEQGIEPPILIRFDGILKDRIKTIFSAFSSAINEFKYRSGHMMAFPIKVNPQRSVVETVLGKNQDIPISLEVGSKPELIAVLPIEVNPESLLLCNGYKDAEYISLALMARKLGKRAIIIIEQSYELNLVIEIANKLGIDAEVGFRMKLSNQGAGRWQSSGGEHAKFGLFTFEIVECIEKLKSEKKGHWLKLLHFHIGSQSQMKLAALALLNRV